MNENLIYRRRKVYDPILRSLHAINAVAILFLLVSGSLEDWVEAGEQSRLLWRCHIAAGYLLLYGLAGRLAWGLVGPRHARFSDFWHPTTWRRFVTSLQNPPHGFGHHPLASLAYLMLYLILLGMAGSGLALAAIEHGMGPFAGLIGDAADLGAWFEKPHEAGYALVIAFITVHIGALIWHESHDHLPLAQSMVSGYQYRLQEGENHEQA